MFSIANNFTAPPVRITSERKPEYHPRTYSQFIKGLKNKELPAVVVKPSENLARFQEAGVGRQGEIGVSDGHTDGCGYDDGTEQNTPF